jgi:hypothetical protein
MLGTGFQERGGNLTASIVDENVEAAEFRDCFFDKPRQLREISHVAWNRERAAAGSTKIGRNSLNHALRTRNERNRSPRFDKSARNPLAYASARAGD